ncbi:MAG: acetylglutamate kinase [Bacteroidales bacterium]
MDELKIIKVGGKIVEEADSLRELLDNFVQLKGKKILVHGGGRAATAMSEQLGIETKMIDGRRITDAATLDVVTMVYGGKVNKKIVTELQNRKVNAIGLTGADMNCVNSAKRAVKAIDYGYVGDIKSINTTSFKTLLNSDIVPVMAPLSYDHKLGSLLNTNADTMASEIAIALSSDYRVSLIYCFEKDGVLLDHKDSSSVIRKLSKDYYAELKQKKIIIDGMIPKLDNAFNAKAGGVNSIQITNHKNLAADFGTVI